MCGKTPATPSARSALDAERAKTAARPWTEAQFNALQDVKGTIKDVGLLWQSHCTECMLFAEHIDIALVAAGVQLYGFHEFDCGFSSSTGIIVWLPVGSNLSAHPLMAALGKAELNPLSVYAGDFSKIRTDIPVICVGERFPTLLTMPYQPTGIPTVTILPIERR